MDVKAHLLEAIAGKNRGLLISEKDKVNILSLIEQLEDRNPTPNPLERSDLLEGDWRLLYTTSKSILGLDNLPLLNLGEIYQCIRIAGAKLYNLAEIGGIAWLDSLVMVSANFEVVSPKRVNVNFQRSIFGLQSLLGYVSPGDFIAKIEGGNKFWPFDFSLGDRPQEGWLEITYLDPDLRIGRGNEGNVFILTKEDRD